MTGRAGNRSRRGEEPSFQPVGWGLTGSCRAGASRLGDSTRNAPRPPSDLLGDGAVSLRVVPVRFADACGFVIMWHRHHGPPVGQTFSLGVADDEDVLRGVAIVGRPVARMLQDGLTPEVTRTATDGTANANSMLYGTSWRAARALGYRRLVTYNQAGESGSSLRAAGWRVVAERRPRPGWNVPSRPRELNGSEGIPRTRWEAV